MDTGKETNARFLSRRDVVEGLLLGVGGVILVPGGVAAADATAWDFRPGRQLVVVDTRFEVGRKFAAAAAGSGWIAREFSGDVTPLWHDLLDSTWHQHAMIHGLTTADSYFCLQQLVADRFWRTTSLAPEGELVRWAMSPAVAVA